MSVDVQGSTRDLILQLLSRIDEIAAGPTDVEQDAPARVVADETVTFSLTFTTEDGDLVSAENITPGTHTLIRLRGGVHTTIVSAAANSASLGRAYFEYDFPTGSWDVADGYIAVWEGVSYTVAGKEYEIPTRYKWGRIVSTYDIDTAVSTIEDEVTHAEHGLGALKTAIDDIEVTVTGTGDATNEHIDDVHAVTDGLITTVDGVVDGIAVQTTAIKAKTDGLAFAGSDVKATLDGETVALTDGSLTAAKLASGVLTSAAFATDSITSTALAANAVAEIQSGLATSVQLGLYGDSVYFAPTLQSYTNATQSAESTIIHSPGTSDKFEIVAAGQATARYASITYVGGGMIYGSAWVRQDSGSTRTIYMNASGGYVATEQSFSVPTATWTKLEFVFPIGTVTSAVAGYIAIYDKVGGAGITWYIDDVVVLGLNFSNAYTQVGKAVDSTMPPTSKSLRDILHKDASYAYDKSTDSLEAISDLINAAISSTPTAKSLRDILHKDTSYTYDKSTDSNEALRDRVDALFGAISTTPTAKSLLDILCKNTSLTYDKATDSLEAISDAIAGLPGSGDAPTLHQEVGTNVTVTTSDTVLFTFNGSTAYGPSILQDAIIRNSGAQAITAWFEVQFSYGGSWYALAATTADNYVSIAAGKTMKVCNQYFYQSPFGHPYGIRLVAKTGTATTTVDYIGIDQALITTGGS